MEVDKLNKFIIPKIYHQLLKSQQLSLFLGRLSCESLVWYEKSVGMNRRKKVGEIIEVVCCEYDLIANY